MKDNYLTCLFLLIVGCFSLGINSKAELIESDWKLESPEANQAPISVVELETREARLQAVQAKKDAEERQLREQKEDIARRRKILIECMNEKDVTLFSVADCPACKLQKAYFGDDFSKLQYIDCNVNKFTCPLRQIKTYPTWYLGKNLGIKKTGVKDLESLAKLTDCPF